MTEQTKSVAEMAAEVKTAFEAQTDAVKAIATEALGKANAGETLSLEIKEKADEALTKLNELKARADEMEQKLARAGNADDVQVKSYGEQFVESDQYKSFQSNSFQGSAKLSLKEVTAAQAGTFSQRDPGITPIGRRDDMVVRDLLNVVQTDSGSIDYVRQLTRTNVAAPVAESAAKPYSAYAWEVVNAPVRVIAHLAKITRQALDDATQLRGEIDSEMRYGLRLAEDSQLLNGSGVGANINGLITQATAYVAPFDPAGVETGIDMIRLGMLQAELALYPPDGVVMHPSDWARIELLKTTEGTYLYGNPAIAVASRLWGLPVVSTVSITIDKFLVGAFKLQTLYDRMAPEVLISSENVDDFEKNLYTMRCEERIALAVKRPQALIYGDFGNVV